MRNSLLIGLTVTIVAGIAAAVYVLVGPSTEVADVTGTTEPAPAEAAPADAGNVEPAPTA